MIKVAKAFAPAHISCVFKIHKHKNPRLMGSSGFGFTLNEGVIVEITKSENIEIYFNNKKISFPTVNKVITSLTKDPALFKKCGIKVSISSPLPLGCGFGLSGASSLATAYALNKLLDLKKSNKELAVIAHIAEVESRTGLGDVVSQYFGGALVRFKPSSDFAVEKIPMTNIPVYCTYFSKLSTKSILEDPKLTNGINKAATIALQKIQYIIGKKNKVELQDILKLSKEYAVNSGLLRDKKTKETIETIEKKGGHASMIMLGNAVMSDIPFEGSTMYKISENPAHLI